MTGVSGTWRLGHRPALDGLRGLAVLMVVAWHVADGPFDNRWMPLGAAGVTVFFTLSGFLITSLLLQEADDTGRVGVSRFYARRARRLLPALAFLLAFVVPLQQVLGLGSLAGLIAVVFYGANWAALAGVDLGLLGHTWSLAVEEQFYLVWPLLFLWVRRWRYGVLIVAAAGWAASTALRLFLWGGNGSADRIYHGSDTQAACLLVGCVLAAAAHHGLPRFARPGVAAALGCAGLASVVLASSPFAVAMVVPAVVPVATAVALWACCSGRVGWLEGAVVRWFGIRSYALYLWHFPVVLLARGAWGPGWATLIAAGVACGMAEVSWRLVERPVLRRRPVGRQDATPARLDPSGRVSGRVVRRDPSG